MCKKCTLPPSPICYTNNMIIYPIIVALIIVADQVTKVMIRSNLALNERISVVGDWMNITYIRNEGAAFSMFSGNVFVTVVLTCVLLIACMVFIVHEIKANDKVMAVCLTCVLGGGLSNMFDRLYFGYVTDMISCGNFAIFNVADMFVTCGCIIAIIYVLFVYKDSSSEEEQRDE